MKRLLTILVALGCATSYCAAQDKADTTPQLPPEQSDIMPTIGTYYYINPPEIYKAIGEPGPSMDKMKIAWDLGNEFIFRTRLRTGNYLPNTSIGLLSNDFYEVDLRIPPDGIKEGSLIVNITSNTVMLKEWKQPQQGGPAYPPQGVGSADP